MSDMFKKLLETDGVSASKEIVRKLNNLTIIREIDMVQDANYEHCVCHEINKESCSHYGMYDFRSIANAIEKAVEDFNNDRENFFGSAEALLKSNLELIEALQEIAEAQIPRVFFSKNSAKKLAKKMKAIAVAAIEEEDDSE